MQFNGRILRRLIPIAVVALAVVSVSGGVRAEVGPEPIATAMPAAYFGPAPSRSADRTWLVASRQLALGAPRWARRLYRSSLLVLRRLSDPRSGAMIAGDREGWRYVWPRDAATGALALEASGHRSDARRVAGFLLGLDAGAAARFEPTGEPVRGRPAAGDAEGWIAAAARAAGLAAPQARQDWQGRQDYGENLEGDLLGNAIAAGAPASEVLGRFGTPRGLAREDAGEELDSAAGWAVVPFARPGLTQAARDTLVTLARSAGRYGIAPSEGWTAGEDWTAPTASSAWALARLGDDGLADRLLAALHRAETPAGTLPERVSAADGRPLSTTPLVWSHAFAALALLARYR
jgi:glucoamylase